MFEELIDQTAAVERQQTGTDASGGTTRLTWSVLLATVGVAIQPASSRTIENYSRRAINVDTTIYSVSDFDALLPKGLKAGDRFNAAGILFIVKGVKRQFNAVISDNPLYEIDCERLIV